MIAIVQTLTDPVIAHYQARFAALRGDRTMAELCRKHRLSDTVVSRWKQQLLKQAHCIFSSTTPDDAMQQRLDDLERLVGRQAVELDAAKKLSAMLP